MSKVIFITGASSGIGQAIALEALSAGHKVVVTSRKAGSFEQMVADHGSNVFPLQLDINDRLAIRQAVYQAQAVFGKIDVLINNAGFGLIGAVEEFTGAEILEQMSVNFIAPMMLIQEVLPLMRSKKSGHIINVSSVAGMVGYPGSSLYAASKHALEGLSQGLAKEVAPFDINVSMINPGPFRTEFAGGSLRTPMRKIDAYVESVHVRQSNLQSKVNGNQAGDPSRAAQAVMHIINMPNPPFTLPLGEMAYNEIPARLHRTLTEIEQYENIGRNTDYPVTESA
jgi:NAD(P)-dependent dehydrogenase (short-subunit alcohol dehydrogenase family)